jgi:hypothetical protein
MKGGYSIPDLMELKSSEFLPWYRIREREIIEEKIVSEVKEGKPIPEGKALKRKIDTEIKRRRGELNGK